MSGIISASSQSSTSASGGDGTTESYQRQRAGGISGFGKDRRKYLDPRLQDELAERI